MEAKTILPQSRYFDMMRTSSWKKLEGLKSKISLLLFLAVLNSATFSPSKLLRNMSLSLLLEGHTIRTLFLLSHKPQKYCITSFFFSFFCVAAGHEEILMSILRIDHKNSFQSSCTHTKINFTEKSRRIWTYSLFCIPSSPLQLDNTLFS